MNKTTIPPATVTASKIIDRAILLEEGGTIVIPCISYTEMEKLRTRLYKLKSNLEKSYRDVAISLDIRRRVTRDKWTLFITKDANLSGIFIVEDGETKPFYTGFEKEIEEKTETKTEDEIMEEVEETEKETKKDFDSVASEMEKAQGLPEDN